MADNYYSEINLHLVWHTKLSRPLLTREVEPMAWAKLREKILSLGDIFSPRNRWHHWSDEFPRSGAPGEDAIWQDDLPRYLINIRAALTLGEAHEGQLTLWTQVERGAPNWPGLRPDRRGARARRRLLAANRRAAACIAQLESTFDDSPGRDG